MPVSKHQFLSLWDFFSKVFVPLNRLELPLKALHKHTCDTIEKAILGNLGKSFLKESINNLHRGKNVTILNNNIEDRKSVV
jgi:hypothetical protein